MAVELGFDPVAIKIEINAERWVMMDEVEREMLVFHELGHCMSPFRAHTTHIISQTNNEVPASLMYPAATNNMKHYYKLFKAAYIEELFGCNPAVVADAVVKYKYESGEISLANYKQYQVDRIQQNSLYGVLYTKRPGDKCL